MSDNMGVPARTHIQKKFSYGCILKSAHGAEGVVHTVYDSYDDMAGSCIPPVGPGWFEMQSIPISTKNQPFYECICIGRDAGSFIVPEDQADEVAR